MNEPLIVWMAEPGPARELLRTTVELDLAGIDAIVIPAMSSPARDSLLVASAATRRTRRIGLIAEMSPWAQPPFLTARALNTLDSLSAGRSGWLVSDVLPPVLGHDDSGRWFADGSEREHRAAALADYLSATAALWNSWEPDAIVADVASGRYVDAGKVHVTNHRGAYFATRGPLNAPRPPQGRPVRMALLGEVEIASPWPDVVVVDSEADVATARHRERRVLLAVRPTDDPAWRFPLTDADGYAVRGVPRGALYGRVLTEALPEVVPRTPREGLLRERFGLPAESFAFAPDPDLDAVRTMGAHS